MATPVDTETRENLIRLDQATDVTTNHYVKIKNEISKRIIDGDVNVDELFEYMQFSFFSHKLSATKTPLLLVDLCKKQTVKFISGNLESMTNEQLSKLVYCIVSFSSITLVGLR